MENSNLLLDFWINVTVERVKRHVHLVMYGDNPRIALNSSETPVVAFDNGMMYEIVGGKENPFVPKRKVFSKERFTFEEVMLDILQRITRNETGAFEVVYMCDTVKRFVLPFEEKANTSLVRHIPFRILFDNRLLELQFATDKFLYYDDRLAMPVMIRTSDGSVVSNDEFAEIGFYQSLEAIKSGEEKQMLFTRTPSESMEDFVKKYYDLSVSEHTSNQFLAHKNIGHDEAIDELPF